jgi:hypothetical protein
MQVVCFSIVDSRVSDTEGNRNLWTAENNHHHLRCRNSLQVSLGANNWIVSSFFFFFMWPFRGALHFNIIKPKIFLNVHLLVKILKCQMIFKKKNVISWDNVLKFSQTTRTTKHLSLFPKFINISSLHVERAVYCPHRTRLNMQMILIFRMILFVKNLLEAFRTNKNYSFNLPCMRSVIWFSLYFLSIKSTFYL